ncbi:MAG: LysR family transcriptional regulator [Proteobacteria bacterium]|nr:LysR family transcriptional regulator [Pseudomonadota bacterium]
MNLNHLRIFYYAAKMQSFTKAAEALCITQPAITKQIHCFEDFWDLKLFRKKGRNIFLTHEGKILFDYAKKIFEYEKKIEDVMGDMKELKLGVLRLGATKTYARLFMPSMIAKFHESYPHIKILLDEGSSREMIKSLLEFKNDVAIVAKVEDNPEIDFIPFCREEIVFVMSPEHHLAGQRGATFQDIALEPFIMKEKGSATRKVVDELFLRNKCVPRILMESGNNEFIKQQVQRGEGISLITKFAVSPELQEEKLTYISLKDQKAFLDIHVAHLKDEPLSPPAKAFIGRLTQLTEGKLSEIDTGACL